MSQCTFAKEPALAQSGETEAVSLKLSGKYLARQQAVAAATACRPMLSEKLELVVPASEQTAMAAAWILDDRRATGARAAASLTVTSSAKLKDISPTLYGVFFEEINFAGEGGLYAELIRNRDFEAMGRGDLGKGGEGNLRPWQVKGTVSIDTSTAPFQANGHVVKIVGSATLTNPGFWGISCVQGKTYKGSFYASGSASISFRLTTATGASASTTATVRTEGSGWRKYTYTLAGTTAAPSASFEAAVTASGAVFLDSISLFPGDAVQGLFRKDLFERLKGLKPAFVRFPGGSYLEGYSLNTRWQWKKTIGLPESRPGHMNDVWGYWDTDGLGLYEYLLLCEALGAKPVLSIFTGYTLDRKYTALSESQVFAQEAVEAVEFAIGNSGTQYGKIRAQMGHAAAFGLDTIEVGNEEYLIAEYAQHYKLITQAVWARFPSIKVIGNGDCQNGVDVKKGNPCLTGQTCNLWDEHMYMSADGTAAASRKYDSYDRSLPKVFVGEWAGNTWAPITQDKAETMKIAAAEGAFIIGLERNADVVKMEAFAPLFRHVSGTQWKYDLISFDSSRNYVLPVYHILSLVANDLCSHTVPATFQGVTTANACVKSDGTIVLKIANYAASTSAVAVMFHLL
eukprot:m51a1_g2947 hypothetical protein (627) ;mRNA; f:622779-625143